MKKIITLLSTILTMFIINAILPDHGTLYWLIFVGSTITTIGILASMCVIPIWTFIHEIRMTRIKHKNNLLEQKLKRDQLKNDQDLPTSLN